MLLRIILIGFILYMLYKMFGGKIALFDGAKDSSKSNKTDANELVECSSCGVYITTKEAIKKGGKFYCSDCAQG